MAAVELYQFKPESVLEETKASNDDSDVSERLSSLFNCLNCVCNDFRETAGECICFLEQLESESRFTEFISRTLFFSAFQCACY